MKEIVLLVVVAIGGYLAYTLLTKKAATNNQLNYGNLISSGSSAFSSIGKDLGIFGGNSNNNLDSGLSGGSGPADPSSLTDNEPEI